MSPQAFYDIHCHLVPGIDDGASDWDVTLAMARMAVADGIRSIICTPHQCGNFAHNRGDAIRARVAEVQKRLDQEQIPLRVLPGADVRIEANIAAGLRGGDLVTLGDYRKHVLLELPHELYFPLKPVLSQLASLGMVGILSHPERNLGILGRPDVLPGLVQAGCLMQVTAGSLLGTFGRKSKQFSETLLTDGLVHFLATDAHGVKARRPRMQRAFERAVELVGQDKAVEICCDNPRRVIEGQSLSTHTRTRRTPRPVRRNWFGLRRAA